MSADKPITKDNLDSYLKELAKEFRKKNGNRVPAGWLNADFINTDSYTPKLIEYSKYYKTFSNILQIRTVSSAYLVAMKLMAGRQYKNDLSDVVGILIEHEARGDVLSLGRIKKAIVDLYGSYEKIPQNSRTFIESIYEKDNLKEFYEQCRRMELENKDILLDFQEDYPGTLNGDNLAEIIKAAKKKRECRS